jgi:membrane-associated phospholipid phosphatase
VAATAGLVALDPHDTPYLRQTSTFRNFNRTFSGQSTAVATLIFPASVYLVGMARRDSYTQHTALLAGEAVADAAILATAMKSVDRRLRPSDLPANGDFSETWFRSSPGGAASFPSGHTIVAFSVATVFAERYGRHRWVPWVAYGLAGLVGFSRVTQQAHFPSDVFAGAVLGVTLTHYAVLRRP